MVYFLTNLDKFIDIKQFNHKKFADDILKVAVDNNKLNELTSHEVHKIIKKWTAEGAEASLDEITKVMKDPEILKAINNKSLKVDSIDDFFKGFKNMFKNVDGDDVTTFAKAAKGLRGGALLDDLVHVFKGVIKTNWVSLLIDAAIETTVFVMTKSAQEIITRFLQGIQAVDVYPLKKHNKPLIAGMNGHKGSVKGYPVQEGYDSIQGMILRFSEMFTNLDGNWPITDWIQSVFVDDHVFSSLAEEWRYDLGIEMSGDMSDEDLVQAAYSNISAMYAANNQQAYSLSTIPRIKKSQLSDYSVLKNFQVINVIPANIPFNETITDMRYVASDPIVAKAMSDERFEIAHTKKTDYITNIAFESGVQSVPVIVSLKGMFAGITLITWKFFNTL